MREIKVGKSGLVALVDDEDFDEISQRPWYVLRAQERTYAISQVFQHGRIIRTLRMHREIMKPSPSFIIDHRDGDGLNNQKANLRICTVTENNRNAIRRYERSIGRGVSWHKATNKWHAYIRVNGLRLHLGLFDDLQEARATYDAAALQHHGEFAVTNQDGRTGIDK